MIVIHVAGKVLAALWAARGGLRGDRAYVRSGMVSFFLCSFSNILSLFFPFITAAGVMQGRMLSRLGVAWCLTAGPLVAACLMGATAVYPNTYMIGIGEIIRKVNAFAGVVQRPMLLLLTALRAASNLRLCLRMTLGQELRF